MIKNFENRFKYSQYYIIHEKIIQDKIKDIKSKSTDVFDDVLKYVPSRYFYTEIKGGYVDAGFESMNKKYYTYDQMMTEPSYYIQKWNSNLHSYYGSITEAKQQVSKKLKECKRVCPNQFYIEHYQAHNYEPTIILLPILHFKSKHKAYLFHKIYKTDIEANVICFLNICNKKEDDINMHLCDRFTYFNILEITNQEYRYNFDIYTEAELDEKNERLNA